MPADIPRNEHERLLSLRRYGILDTPPEPAFDDLAAMASFVCGTPIALVSLVDENRQWFKAAKGLEDEEMPRDLAFCAHAILGDGPMIVSDTHRDRRFADHPLVTDDPKIRFYAGALLVDPDGHKLGTLCAIDSKPRELDDRQIELLDALARQAMAQLELRRSLDQLQRLNRSKDRLFTLISHDLRSPLQAILGFAELLDQRFDTLPPATLREYNGRVLESARRAHRLMENLFDLARFELGEMTSQRRSIAIEPVVRETVSLLSGELERKAITFDLSSDEDTSAHTDPRLLQPVLRNLLSNAIKFSHPGGRVTLRLRRNSHCLDCEVEDEGVGMSPETLRTFLSGASQVSTPGTAGETGTGVGMMLVHRLVERLAGRLDATSEPGDGCRVVLSLPTSGH